GRNAHLQSAKEKSRPGAAFFACSDVRGGSALGAEPRHPACLQELAAPVAGVEFRHGDVATGTRRVQEAAFADVDADMVDALAATYEERWVARHQRGAFHLLAVARCVERDARQLDAERGPEHVADQAAAIETAPGRGAAPAVGRAEQGQATPVQALGA